MYHFLCSAYTLIKEEKFILALAFFVVIYLLARFFKKISHLPPGPFPVTFYGNLFHFHMLPHHDLYRLSKNYGDIMTIWLSPKPYVVLSSGNVVQKLYKHHDEDCASRTVNSIMLYGTGGARNISFSLHGEFWKKARKLSTLQLLCPRQLELSKGIREDEVCKMIEAIAIGAEKRNGVIVLKDFLSLATLNIILRVIASKRFHYGDLLNPSSEASQLFLLIGNILDVMGAFNPAAYSTLLALFDSSNSVGRSKKLGKEISTLLDGLIKEHIDEKIMLVI